MWGATSYLSVQEKEKREGVWSIQRESYTQRLPEKSSKLDHHHQVQGEVQGLNDSWNQSEKMLENVEQDQIEE